MKPMTIPGLLFLTLMCLGCSEGGPPTVPVTGTVFLDGKPIEGATVNFLSEELNIAASGDTDATGKFTLKSIFGTETIDGAVVGKHGVAVVKTSSDGQQIDDPKAMMAQMAANPAITSNIKVKYEIPAKYNNPTMSGMSETVTEGGPNNFTIELKSR